MIPPALEEMRGANLALEGVWREWERWRVNEEAAFAQRLREKVAVILAFHILLPSFRGMDVLLVSCCLNSAAYRKRHVSVGHEISPS